MRGPGGKNPYYPPRPGLAGAPSAGRTILWFYDDGEAAQVIDERNEDYDAQLAADDYVREHQ